MKRKHYHYIVSGSKLPSDEKNSKKNWTENFNTFSTGIKNWVMAILILVIILILVSFAFLNERFKKTSLIIEPFLVHHIKDSIYFNGITLAQNLSYEMNTIISDEMNTIKNYGKSFRAQSKSDGAIETATELHEYKYDHKVSFNVAGTTVTIGNIKQFLNSFFGKAPIKVNGYLHVANRKYLLTVRLANGLNNIFVRKEIDDVNNIDSILSVTAEELLKHLEPGQLAIYLIDNKRESNRINEVIKHMVKNGNNTNDYHIDAFFTKAYYLHDKGLYKEAALNSKLAHDLDTDKKFSNILINWGNSLLYSHEYLEAKVKFTKALKIDAHKPAAWLGLGQTEFNLKNKKAAEMHYKKVLTLDPINNSAYFNLAYLAYDLGHFDDAVNYYQTATLIDPDDSPAFFNLGMSLYTLGRFEESGSAYKKAIIADSKNIAAYTSYGNSLSKMNYFDEADFYYEQALTNSGRDSFVVICRAHSKFNQANNLSFDYPNRRFKLFTQALQLYRVADRIKREKGEAKFGSGICYAKLGEPEKATITLRQSLREFEKSAGATDYQKAKRLYFRSVISQSLGYIDNAKILKQKALRLDPYIVEKMFIAEF